MTVRVVSILFLVCSWLILSAQESDTIHPLGGVEIKADRISVFSTGLKIEKFDSTMLALRQGVSLNTLLSEQTAVFLRSYGPGGIATLSMRGTNASHSGVFWNGINLNQPNMGMTDLSRISTFEFSDISMESGGASALLGTGVIGGSLHLTNTMRFSGPVNAAGFISASSIGRMTGAAKLSAGNRRLAYVGSLSGDWNQNNFWYTDYSGDRKQLEHGLSKSLSSVHQVEYILNQKQRLSAGFWFQATDREIPPTLTMNTSDQQQWDQAIRSSLQWMYADRNQSFTARSAYIDEKEHYLSENADIDAFYHLNTLQSEFEYKRYLNKQFTLGSGITGKVIRADIPYYEGTEYQPEGSVWLALAHTHLPTGIKSALNLRQDFAKGYSIPFCPAFNAEVPVTKMISANFGVSRNFRVPTMNDRYWVPGGNPDLKPESSWNAETGASFRFNTGKSIQSLMAFNIYSLAIDNMIVWIPGDAGIWSPMNVQKVWSRGVELSSKTDMEMYGFKGYFKLAYNYTPSTYRETAEDESEILNKQLVYIPIHKVVETFYVSKLTYYAVFSYSLTGKRYVKSDNSEDLPAYSILDIYAGTSFKVRKVKVRLQAEFRNILNEIYQSVLYYPEPGRSFAINILISN